MVLLVALALLAAAPWTGARQLVLVTTPSWTATNGTADAAPAGTRLGYTRSGETTRCVDDPASTRYNQIVDGPGDWKSAEVMRRADGLYDWVIVVGHNAARVP